MHVTNFIHFKINVFVSHLGIIGVSIIYLILIFSYIYISFLLFCVSFQVMDFSLILVIFVSPAVR